jgi:hypothetical protein
LQCHRGLRRQTIVQSLLADVFQGRLRAGTHLVTQELAARFGVSHTPIREALITLAGIGIIDLLPNRGAVVRRVTPHEVREVCQVRRVLECEAVRRACGRIDLAELHALAVELKRLKSARPNGTRFIEEARALRTSTWPSSRPCWPATPGPPPAPWPATSAPAPATGAGPCPTRPTATDSPRRPATRRGAEHEHPQSLPPGCPAGRFHPAPRRGQRG